MKLGYVVAGDAINQDIKTQKIKQAGVESKGNEMGRVSVLECKYGPNL